MPFFISLRSRESDKYRLLTAFSSLNGHVDPLYIDACKRSLIEERSMKQVTNDAFICSSTTIGGTYFSFE